jgi:hypothetical protein
VRALDGAGTVTFFACSKEHYLSIGVYKLKGQLNYTFAFFHVVIYLLHKTSQNRVFSDFLIFLMDLSIYRKGCSPSWSRAGRRPFCVKYSSSRLVWVNNKEEKEEGLGVPSWGRAGQ